MDLGSLNLPRAELVSAAFPDTLQTRLFLQYAPVLADEPGRRLMAMLQADPRVAALHGRMLSRGGGWNSFQVEMLAIWLLWRINETDLETAQGDLSRFLDSETVQVLSVLWLTGLTTANTVALCEGVSLVPIDEMPDSVDKEAFLKDRPGHQLGLSPIPRCALVKECTVPRDIGDQDDWFASDGEFREANTCLHDYALLLNVLPSTCAVPYYSTSYVSDSTPLGPLAGSGGGMPVYDVMGGVVESALQVEHVALFEEIAAAYVSRSDAERERLARILDRLSQAKRRTQPADKVLDLGIAVEMLLLDDNGRNEQLSLSFRLRGSWLLGTDVADRTSLIATFKDLYSYRSQVAHSGVLCKGRQADVAKAIERLPDFERVAESACRAIILNGRPNWDHLLVGSS